MKTRNKNKVINIVTLGCSKNTSDSEFLARQLKENHAEIRYDSNEINADVVIINTCGFIHNAKEESIDTILEYVKAKEQGLIDKLIVMGCLSERYKSELEKEIPEVDAYFGVTQWKEIVESLGFSYKHHLPGERIVSTPAHYAYLKISEGCDRQCAFCAIPLIRGEHKSKTVDEIIQEADFLVSQGVKEVMLIAQDLTYYGVDIYRKQALAHLLSKLSDVKGLEWIRLHYAYPAGFPKEVIEVMKKKENICDYLDIPFQHISNLVLKKMKRGNTRKFTYDLIQYLRDTISGITLRTTLLVGHPGETAKEFEELKQFVKDVQFDRLGVFTYSEEEGTFGAKNYSDVLAPEQKQRRADEIMAIQREISAEKNKQLEGTVKKVIIDREESEFYIGRTEADSPEIDNEVLISKQKSLKTGEFYPVKITGSDDFDLYADII